MTAPPILPRISIVTPSYNQGEYIGHCLQNIADQSYPDLEHIVIDGGSTDDSVEVIRRHAGGLAYWVSEKDDGQYDAINKGLSRATGEVMAWLNADDVYMPWALRLVGEIFAKFPEVEWLTTLHPFAIDMNGLAIKLGTAYGFDRTGFLQANNLVGAGWPGICFIQQESTFWRRSLWEKAGGRIDPAFRYAGDFDLWARFFALTRLHGIDVPLGIYRRQPNQKTANMGGYLEEAKASLTRHGGRIPQGPMQVRMQGWRLAARRQPALRRFMTRFGEAEAASIITYNWGTQEWERQEA